MIGISPGTRSVGFAIMKDGILIDWGVKLFKEEWSNEKLKKIIGVLDIYVNKYHVSTIAIKQHPPFRLSVGLEHLYDEIRDWAKNLNIKIREFTIEELKIFCNNLTNKNSLIDYIYEKYPEVKKTIERTKNIKYHIKTIEALALVHAIR